VRYVSYCCITSMSRISLLLHETKGEAKGQMLITIISYKCLWYNWLISPYMCLSILFFHLAILLFRWFNTLSVTIGKSLKQKMANLVIFFRWCVCTCMKVCVCSASNTIMHVKKKIQAKESIPFVQYWTILKMGWSIIMHYVLVSFKLVKDIVVTFR